MQTTTQDFDTSHAPPQRPLPVVPEQRETWNRLLNKGIANRLDLRADGADLVDDGGEVHRYRVSSLSKPGTWHIVTVGVPSHGAPVVACDCEASRVPIPCSHAAIALDLAQAWPREMPMLRHTEHSVPSPRYRTGDTVRVISSGKRGIVDYSALPNGRDWMYVVNGTRGAALGAFMASELKPDSSVVRDGPSASDTAVLFMAPRERRAAS